MDDKEKIMNYQSLYNSKTSDGEEWSAEERFERFATLIEVWQSSECRSEVLEWFKTNSHDTKLRRRYRNMRMIMQDVRYLRQKGVDLKDLYYNFEYSKSFDKLREMADKELLRFVKGKI